MTFTNGGVSFGLQDFNLLTGLRDVPAFSVQCLTADSCNNAPFGDKVVEAFDEEDQPFRIRNYRQDLKLRKLKPSG